MDSNDAKKHITAIKYLADVGESNTNSAIVAERDINNPINCANLLGGPGTSLVGDPRAGTIILVAKRPIGLNVGPVNTRARNPYVIKSNKNSLAVIKNEATNKITTAATDLAA